MKKILISLLVAMFLVTPAYAWVQEHQKGPTNVTWGYVVNEADLVSGDVVVLQTTNPTYWGGEVTTTTTAGMPIYGVVLGDPSAAECDSGTWIRIQTHGYCPIVRLAHAAAVTVDSTYICTSTEYGRATSCKELNYLQYSTGDAWITGPNVTGNSIALESVKAKHIAGSAGIGSPGSSGSTFKALLSW